MIAKDKQYKMTNVKNKRVVFRSSYIALKKSFLIDLMIVLIDAFSSTKLLFCSQKEIFAKN